MSPSSGSPVYSVIVPAYNEAELLPQTLASVHEAMAAVPELGEIVVCDNNSTDATAQIARDNNARVIFEPVNQIARARNTGAAAARGQFFVFLDADTLLPPETLRGALAALQSGKYCGGGTYVFPQTPVHGFNRVMVNTWNRISAWRKWAAGSFVYCRRDAFESIDGFPTRSYAGEEIYFSKLLQEWGREHRQTMHILGAPGIRTSMRKFEQYSTTRIVFAHLILALCPPLARHRRFCGFWYKR